MQTAATDEVLIRREGRAGRITMNRPKALNALTHAMVGRIWDALLAWKDDAGVELVLLDGAGDRALCAGGDVRSLYESRTQGSAIARTFWRDEYRLNALIGRYPKPYVAIQDGIVMGGGIGLSAHARHRIVTERSQLAMPETGIGLIPDVGGSWLLSRTSAQTGIYLGLTGEAMRAADAIYGRFADAFVPPPKIPALVERLCGKAARLRIPLQRWPRARPFRAGRPAREEIDQPSAGRPSRRSSRRWRQRRATGPQRPLQRWRKIPEVASRSPMPPFATPRPDPARGRAEGWSTA